MFFAYDNKERVNETQNSDSLPTIEIINKRNIDIKNNVYNVVRVCVSVCD